MCRDRITLTEMLLIIFIVIVFSFAGYNWLKPVRGHLRMNCSSNLRGIGTALFQYESPSYYNVVPLAPLSPDGKPTDNAVTLSPIVLLYKAGLLDNPLNACCPFYRVYPDEKAPYEFARELNDKAVGFAGQYDKFADELIIRNGNRVNTNYLFTQFYAKNSLASRVILADAGCDPSAKDPRLTPNHGNSDYKPFETPNVLFKDNHVKSANELGEVEGASDPGNLWDDIDPPTADNLTKTRIGHY